MKTQRIIILGALLALACSLSFAQQKPATVSSPPAPSEAPAKEADLQAQVKKLTEANAELVKAVQILIAQRNQAVEQLLDTQAQAQLAATRKPAN